MPDPLFLEFNQVDAGIVAHRPTEHLARLTNATLQQRKLAMEARSLILHSIKHPIPDGTLALIKGENVDVLMLAPDHLLAIIKPERALEAIKLSLHLLGCWKHMSRPERIRLRGML